MGTSNIRTAAKHDDSSEILFDSSACRYEDVEANGIIFQGKLYYLSSNFKEYRAVVTILNTKNEGNIVGLYLFKQTNMNLKEFFRLDQTTILSDFPTRSEIPANKLKLIEMKFNDKNPPEIFGTETERERDNWKRLLGDKIKSLIDSIYLQPSETNEISVRNISDKNNPILYPEFDGQNNEMNRLLSNTNSLNSGYSMIADIDRPQANNLLPMRFDWNDIFYSNENNNFERILERTRQFGTFLVRPSRERNHHYTLCVYHQQSKSKCFPISQQRNANNNPVFRLPRCENSNGFDSIVRLCEYYIENPLPSSDRIYLTKPYKFFYRQ